ncbi:MAG: hypothetical protein AAB519_03865 [Patescibacteria group bacterium]
MEHRALIAKHVKSFVKTYVTAFLAITLFAYDQGTDIFTLVFLLAGAKVSFIAALRNVYKFLTEDV